MTLRAGLEIYLTPTGNRTTIYPFSSFTPKSRSVNVISSRAKFVNLLHHTPVDHPTSYTMGTRSISWGIKRPGRGVNHPPSSSAEVKESSSILLVPLWAFMICSRANFNSPYAYRRLQISCSQLREKETFVFFKSDIQVDVNMKIPWSLVDMYQSF